MISLGLVYFLFNCHTRLRLQTKMGKSSEPMTWQSTSFKNSNFERGNFFFRTTHRSKVVKFAKTDPHDALIILARDEQFWFFPLKWSKGRTVKAWKHNLQTLGTSGQHSSRSAFGRLMGNNVSDDYKEHIPSKVIFHQKLSVIKSCLPLKFVFH